MSSPSKVPLHHTHTHTHIHTHTHTHRNITHTCTLPSNPTGSLRSPHFLHTEYCRSIPACLFLPPHSPPCIPLCLFGSSHSETGHKISWKELRATESGAFSTLGGDLPYAPSHVRPRRRVQSPFSKKGPSSSQHELLRGRELQLECREELALRVEIDKRRAGWHEGSTDHILECETQ